MSERRFVVDEVGMGLGALYDITETELRRRLDAIINLRVQHNADNWSWDKAIDILLHGEKSPNFCQECGSSWSDCICHDHYNPEVQPDVNNEWEDALKLCVEAIEVLHPELDPKEPCVVYNAWNNAKKLLERAEPVPAKPTLNDSFKYPYYLLPKPTRKE